jgi:hypothetical protein
MATRRRTVRRHRNPRVPGSTKVRKAVEAASRDLEKALNVLLEQQYSDATEAEVAQIYVVYDAIESASKHVLAVLPKLGD